VPATHSQPLPPDPQVAALPSAAARDALQQHFGYPSFRPGQEAAVESVLAGRDTLVVLPTGGGKSLCYQVPALMLPKLTVVLSPLISLMKDQVDALEARGLPATFVNSTLTGSQVADRLARATRGEFKLLYLAPERFDFGSTAERLKESGVSLLAVDEAHCISEWGHDFRPSYLRIAEIRERLGNPTTVALTATATPHVRTDIVAQLRMGSPRTIITGFDRTNLRYHVVPTRTDSDKDDALVHLLRTHAGQAIVYAATRKAVERIAALLDHARLPALAYHAGVDDGRRHEIQDAFMREKTRVIVATNAFGMGIDKANVRLVVHYAMPGSLEAYYQEAGRAGRDGERADCYLLHAFPDRFTHEFFIRNAYPEQQLVEEIYDVLRKAADRSGAFDLDAATIALRVKQKSSAREVESALRILAQAGAIVNEQETAGKATVRLLATPARITKELTGDASAMELGLLRALWRVAGRSLEQGTAVDLDGLPPGFGGVSGCVPLLDALQSRQFVQWSRIAPGARLAAAHAALSRYSVDWNGMDRRRRADIAKLDTMQSYAYAKTCRRGFVLRYFGDPAAQKTCGNCDNCLGTSVVAERAPRPISSRPRSAQRGSSQRGEGRGAGRAREAAASPEDLPTPTGADAALLARLRDLRTTIAREEQVPAYVVFTDRTLAELAVRRPGSLSAAGEIRGVGPVKLEKYGERFLNVIRASDDTEAA
jgi:ATP-dependent DNA helicase RecQ